MKPTKEIVVKQDEQEPVAVEVLAKAIVEIAEGMKRVNRSRLTRRALMVLIRDHTNVPLTTIQKVLDSLDQLETLYLKKK